MLDGFVAVRKNVETLAVTIRTLLKIS